MALVSSFYCVPYQATCIELKLADCSSVAEVMRVHQLKPEMQISRHTEL